MKNCKAMDTQSDHIFCIAITASSQIPTKVIAPAEERYSVFDT
jgi:hypothetical protein